jgi:hypothetical protein
VAQVITTVDKNSLTENEESAGQVKTKWLDLNYIRLLYWCWLIYELKFGNLL